MMCCFIFTLIFEEYLIAELVRDEMCTGDSEVSVTFSKIFSILDAATNAVHIVKHV